MPEPSLAIFEYRDIPGSHTLGVARQYGAYESLRQVLAENDPDQVIEVVKASGLRGRGGAGFPCGLKWSFMPKEDGKPHYLVINADEGEPGTCKDREILSKVPHKMIEGILIGCHAIRANKAFIYIRGEMWKEYHVVVNAVKECYEAGLLGENILNSGWSCDIVVHRGAGAYICGEETALLDSLDGKRGHPRMKPPFPAQAGAFGMPTTINNVETLAAVPAIIRYGAAWYTSFGTEKSPGTKIFSLSGHVNRPGNYEVPLGIPLSTFVNDYGQGMRHGRAFKAVMPGGGSSQWLGPEHWDVPLDYEALRNAGTMLGSGAVMPMDETTCIVEGVWRLAKFFQHESCGKCTPCFEGTWWIERMLRRILIGEGKLEDLDILVAAASNIEGKSFCPFGDAASWPVQSTIKRWREEFEHHILHPGSCLVQGHGAHAYIRQYYPLTPQPWVTAGPALLPQHGTVSALPAGVS
ncbi:MAG: NADH-quinone oxidoreductase subunit F [bacterium]|nr:NADH-quinone oxidoreductase subunit F [bacterium]